MWFRLVLRNIDFKLRINDYQPFEKKRWHTQWCTTDFSFTSGDWLHYVVEQDQTLLSSEIEALASRLDDLLQDKLTEVKTIECTEPDFQFVLKPKRDLRDDPRYLYIKEGHEIVDAYMETRLFFGDGGIVDNYLSVTFDRKNIEYLKYYLLFVMKKVKKSNSVIQKMIQKGILVEE